MTKARWLRFILMTLFGGTIVVVMFIKADLATVSQIVLSIDVRWFWGASAICCLSHVVNGYRIRLCLDAHLPVLQAAAISSVHTLFLNFMPFRSGEVSFMILVRKYAGNTTIDSFTGLSIQRFWDSSILLLLSVFSCFITAMYLKALFYLTLISAAGLFGIILTSLIILVLGPSMISNILEHIQGKFLYKYVAFFTKSLDLFKLKYRRRITGTALLSLMYWGLVVIQTYGFFSAFYPIGFLHYVVLCTLISLWAIVPVHGFLAIGTSEGALVFIMSHMGVDLNMALGIAIGFRAAALAANVLCASIGALILFEPWCPGRKTEKKL